jgi:hypothetical protein
MPIVPLDVDRVAFVNLNSVKSQDLGIGPGRAFSSKITGDMARFETCSMLRRRLDMYSFAPMKDTGRPV